MKTDDSATLVSSPPLPQAHAGLWWGLLGVAAFSFTVPFTRVAVGGGHMSPLFVGSGRAVIAALLAAAALWLTRQQRPRGTQWARVAVVAGGAVVGFPLLTSYALTTAPASHGAVVIALLPAATAVMAVIRGRERPRTPFWVAAGIGAIAAVVFAAIQGGGLAGLHRSDLLLFAAVIVCAIGYAEGGLLSRELGSWQTISWALVLASPLMIVLTGVSIVEQPPTGSVIEWGAFAYLAVVSMFLGFFAWYRGLAIGPMAQVSQVQLTQPVMSICWAALLLHEHLAWPTILGGIAVIGCALLAVRARNRGNRPASAPGPHQRSTVPGSQPVRVK
ncbi:DMT family transporter [Micromonospora sp. NBC_01405]|uniref:DMT family transporter n=1 Tax=Micromonospora sp. NBC_01405 TaxID=2903589 RepID=UPI003243AFE3